MDEADRKEYLREVERKGSTIGASLPERIRIGDEELQLDEFLIETRKVDRVSEQSNEIIADAKRVLRAERDDRVEALETESLTHEQAQSLLEEINGLDRALNALETIRRPNYGAESRNARIDDHKKWLDFLDDIRR